MPETPPLAGRVVLIAGASSGMGRATALAAARAGADLMLVARRGDALTQVREEIVALRGEARVSTHVADASSRSTVADAVGRSLEEFGRIDVLVNAVGTNIPRRALDELTTESWSSMIADNLTAAFNLTQAVVPVMRRQKDGLIIHISSVAARKPDRSGLAYQATKAGVVALAHATSEEERGNGVRVSVIMPGMTDTPLLARRPTPVPEEARRAALQPDDIAQACLFVMGLPARAHVPEILLQPSRL